MTPEALRQIVEAGESLEVEFKGEGSGPFNDRDLVDTIVCLANRRGSSPSWLLVGVEDDRRISGARGRHENGKTDVARLTALVANRTRPSLTVGVHIVPIDGLEVLVIEVAPSGLPVGTTDGRYLRRTLGGDGRPACMPMQFHDMQLWKSDRGLLDYSALPVPGARWDDLDLLEIERFRRCIRERRGRSDEALLGLSDLELVKVLGGVESDGQDCRVRVLGLLLFGKADALSRFIPTHEVAFQVLRGQEVEVNDFFRWPLLRVMEELESRVRVRNREQELMVGLLRVGVPDYSELALREALANALVHRDYLRQGAMHFQWFGDRIEVSNPGGLPEGVRLDNLLVTAPRPRNPLLADAFKRAGLVERTARGIDTIFYEQLRNGRPAPSYGRSDPWNVVVVLPGGEANLEFVRFAVEEGLVGRSLLLDDLLLLNSFWQERTLTTEEAARLIQKPESEVRGILGRLLELGLLEARGTRKGRNWHLSASTYRRLGQPASYVHQRGFEPLQQEQMILQYVERHGRITRREAAELCRLSLPQSYRLLDRLSAAGRLARQGAQGRAVSYSKGTE